VAAEEGDTIGGSYRMVFNRNRTRTSSTISPRGGILSRETGSYLFLSGLNKEVKDEANAAAT